MCSVERQRRAAVRTSPAGSDSAVTAELADFAGKLTGDAKLTAEGLVEQVEGKVENAKGGLDDASKRS